MIANQMCHVPVKATYRVIDGKPVRVAAVYADIPAVEIAKLILRGFGRDPVPASEHKEEQP